jgi:Fe-S cluster assembly protein SufD
MTSVLEQASSYLEPFTQLKSAEPWLQRLRDQAFERFTELGFPTTHDEEWRFTNVAPIAKAAFQPAQRPDFWGANLESFPATQFVFVNGYYVPEMSSQTLPAGVTRKEISAAEQHLGRYASFERHPFVALNTAFIEEGAFMEVARGAIVSQPIHLVYLFTGESQAISHPRNLVLIGSQAQVTVVESFAGIGSHKYFTNAVTEIVAGESAIVDHYKVQQEAAQAFHIASMHVQLARDANFTSHSISLGGALVRNDITGILSEGTECTMNGFYHVTGTQHVDNHTTIDHAKPHGTSHELYKGILDGKATAVFNGKILVRKDAQKTDAKQTNKNLVLSEDAAINTKPELQIWADDVRCTHGATIGQIDQESVFYLQSRGIGRDEARSILTLAFARDILDRIKIEPLREQLERLVLERLTGAV